jgi:predicted deacylase
LSDSQHSPWIDVPVDVAGLPPGRHRLWRRLTSMADGSDLGVPMIILRGAVGPRLVAIAGIHGDEHDGPAALFDAAEAIDPADLLGTLVIVPVANPPAFRTVTRRNVADGQNLNRIFPGEAGGSVSHRLARVVVDEVVPGADFVLAIHGWTAGWLTVPYVEYTAGHPTTTAARGGAAAFGLSYLEPLGLLPGRLMSHLAGLGIPGCEVEIGGEGITLPDRAAVGTRGVLGLLRHLGMLRGVPEIPDVQRDVTRHEVRAEIGGAFRREPSMVVGRSMIAGEPIGTVVALEGSPLATVEAPVAGVLACLRHALSVEPGDLLAVVFADATPGADAS